MTSVSHYRWIAKKLGRMGLAASMRTFGNGDRYGPSLHVLTYHRFGNSIRDPFCVPRQTFAKQMHQLATQNLVVSLAKLQAHLAGTTEVPSGGVVVTIDDACLSVFTEAWPILRDYAIPAVLFVPAGMVGNSSLHDFGERVLRWDEIASMQRHGMTIGSHAFHHWSMARLDLGKARAEAIDSRVLLSTRLDTPITTFAYPFGTRVDFNATTRAILHEAGYEIGFTSRHGAIRAGSDVLELPRIKVEGGDPDWMFPLLCTGAMDAWRVIEAAL